MKRTMHSIAREALAAYPKAARTQWILQWPGQLVLNCSQVSLQQGPTACTKNASLAPGFLNTMEPSCTHVCFVLKAANMCKLQHPRAASGWSHVCCAGALVCGRYSGHGR